MSRQRLLTALSALAVAIAAALLGSAFRESSSAAPSIRGAGSSAADRLQSGFSAGDTAGLVSQLQRQLRAEPRNPKDFALLGLAYQQRARETGDPSYYPKSYEALRRALALEPHNLLAVGGLGSLALARHRFREALELARKARRLSPSTARTYGVIGDALVELGRYREAFAAFDTIAALRPSLAAYARVSYARELLGRQRAAIGAMRLALDAASGQEATAWTHVQLGKLYWSAGRLAPAASEYRAALAIFPGYAYALDALAQVEAARGHLRRASALERQAVDTIPLPQYVGTLGDLYRATGQRGLARNQYALVGAIRRLLAANGVKTDLEIALFNADHGIRPAETLALAREARRDRPSIDGDDVLAWALERNGRCAEAVRYSKSALRLGTRDALKFFHRGMIERCLGREASAQSWFQRALRLNPHFSLHWGPVARRYT
jgi:tetratricopeptide (TPR) repeat protein